MSVVDVNGVLTLYNFDANEDGAVSAASSLRSLSHWFQNRFRFAVGEMAES